MTSTAIGSALTNKSGGISVTILNLGPTLQKLGAMDRALTGAFMGGVYLFACQIITSAVRLAPAVTGFLRSSRYVRKPALGGPDFTIDAGFSASYAWYVEKMLRNHHPIGQAEFLATAIAQNLAQNSIIARTTKTLYRRGATIDSVRSVHPTAPIDPYGRPLVEARASQRRERIYGRRARQQTRRRHEGAKVRWE